MITPLQLGALRIEEGAHPRGLSFLSAASGLVRTQGRIYVIADDEHHLAVFDEPAPHSPGRMIRLLEGDLPASTKKRKARKADLESLAHLPAMPGLPSGALLALGSGSRANRHAGMLMPLAADGRLEGSVRRLDLKPLYGPLRDQLTELNIEGSMVIGDELLLLQRGNQGGGSNGSIHLALADVLPWMRGETDDPIPGASFRPYDLGTIEGTPLCFTDGAPLPGGGWMFSAVAEQTDDSYADGALLGAAIGVIDAAGNLQCMWPLAPGFKVEGIAAEGVDGMVVVTMVTDADDPEIPSQLLSVTLPPP